MVPGSRGDRDGQAAAFLMALCWLVRLLQHAFTAEC
jgi:hypothetical protein